MIALRILLSASYGCSMATTLVGTKLIEVRPVDQSVLMIVFKDGEVFYRDDGTGPSAFSGHDWAEGDDRLVAYAPALDVVAAADPRSWRLSSTNDPAYAGAGLHPVRAMRKSKVNSADHDWNYHLDHWIFLEWPQPLRQGGNYMLHIAAGTHRDTPAVPFRFDWSSHVSEAIHVNLIGYPAHGPVKGADLYLWLGDGGPRDYSRFVGKPVWLIEVDTAERHRVGEVRFWKQRQGEAEGRNLTGSDVWNIDFCHFTRPGRYRLAVEDVGASATFEITDAIYREPFATSVRGYYYMRIGEPITDIRPIPRQPRFIPGEDPSGFRVYLTDLHPFHPVWKGLRGDVWDEPHFKQAEDSVFWRHRLPGNPTNPHAWGGHSDALDWDRHLAHVSDAYDLLMGYLLSGGKLDADDTGIRESGNGIPDLVDEARNEVDLWLRLRDGEAYAHGLTNPARGRQVLFQAGTTTMAAWANAANCAMLADAFRLSGHATEMGHYRDEAIRAYRFAGRQADPQLGDLQDVGDSMMRGRDFRMMAAAFLFNVTGEMEWEEVMAADSVVAHELQPIEARRQWNQFWGTAAYLLSPRERRHPELWARMRAAVRAQAFDHNVRFMDQRPSRRSSNNNWWQTAHNLHLVVLAHAVSDSAADRQQLHRAMLLEAEWGLGRNPGNIVEMTGLGSRRIENCYTSGRNDGTPGLHPGHTPYNNLEPWGGPHNGSNPRWFAERGYPDWDQGGWPHQEAHFNNRYCWANAEFTPRQTMRGKTLLYAYLYALSL
jgi:endoglucanase